jgi:hypothetical protein
MTTLKGMVDVLVQASLRDALRIDSALPPVELAGLCQAFLRDWALRIAEK